MTGPFGDSADTYRMLGWTPLPLPERSKSPPPRGTTGRNARDPSDADHAAWLANHGDGNIALRLPVGVIALDVDHHGDKTGGATIAELEAKLGPLPATFVNSARPWPSGHRFYRVPAGTELQGQAGPHVDLIQRHHRYVVIAPSVHPDRMLYKWSDPEGEPCAPPAPEDLPELPAAWIAALAVGAGPPLAAPEPPGQLEPGGPVGQPVFVDPDPTGPAAIVARHRRELPGGRHDATVRAAAALARAVVRGQPGAFAALEDVREQFRVAVERDPGGREPGAWRAEWRRIVDSAEGLVKRTPDVGAGEHGDDTGEVTGLVDWDELWAAPDTSEDFLAAPLLARGRSHVVYAGAKSGKSLLLLNVAAALASGRSALGQPEAPPVNVLYLDYEMTAADLRERLDAMGYGPGDDLSRFHYYLLPTLPPLDAEAGSQAVAGLLDRHHPELVVIDTTSRALGGAENDADTIRNYYRHTGARLKRAGCTVVRLDHSGKDAERGQRGTSAKVDDVDVVWRMTPADGAVRLVATHRRVSWIPEAVTLRQEEAPLRHVQSSWCYRKGATELAATLDRLGVPSGAGRPAARAALVEADIGARNDVLADALRLRRDRSLTADPVAS